jgi:hypothetical protein
MGFLNTDAKFIQLFMKLMTEFPLDKEHVTFTNTLMTLELISSISDSSIKINSYRCATYPLVKY